MTEVGAWRSFDELEDWLTLTELMTLYDMTITKQNRFMKTIASAMGAEFEDEEDDEDGPPQKSSMNLTSDGQIIPGSVNTTAEADMVNAFLGGSLLGYEQH